MRYKATFLVGFGAGYVLGAKAGRARYEQIMRNFRGLMGRDDVQSTLDLAKHEATDLLSTAKDKVTSKLGGEEIKTTGNDQYVKTGHPYSPTR